MTYRFECRCGKKLQAGDGELGEEILCPGCGARILLPFKSDGAPFFVRREPLARLSLVLSLLPVIVIIYADVETVFLGGEAALGNFFNAVGALLWLGQVVPVVLGLVSLRRIRKAEVSGGHLDGEREATVAVVLGSVWLTLFVRFLFFHFLGV